MPSPRTILILAWMPFFVRKAVCWSRLFCDPFRGKRTMRMVSVTSVERFGKVAGWSNWGILVEFHPLTVSFGAIARKPAAVGDRVDARELLGMTIVFDHDVVDGRPVAISSVGCESGWKAHAAWSRWLKLTIDSGLHDRL